MKITRKGLRLLALTLCMAVMLGLTVPALAANIYTYGKVIADNTKVYSTQDKTTVIGTFAKNDIVGIESQISAKGVYVIRTSATGTATGYIEKTAITLTNAAALSNMKAVSGGTATTGTIYNVSSYVNMRSSASSSGTVVAKPTKGATVTILGESGSYYQVSYDGKTGYISKSYVQVTSSGSSGSGTTTGTPGVIYNVSSYANMRSKASASGTLVAKPAKGASVTILSQSGDFYQVSYDGKTGYIDKRYVQVSSGSSDSGSTTGTPGVIYNVTSYANMRSKASTSGSVIAKPAKGASVTILGQSGDFYQVSYDGKTGYVDKRYVQAGSDATPPTTGSVGGKDTGVITVGKGDIKVMPYESTTPSAIQTALTKAQKANSDVIGYISINGTNISQPILFRKGDVHYYATHSPTKASSSSGAIYAFYGDMVRNNTITGHNMRQTGTMFHQLHYLQEKTLGFTVHQTTDSGAKKGSLTNIPSLTVAANRLWNVSLFGYNQWQVWAMYETPANESTSTLKYNINPLSSYSPSQVKTWIEYQKNRSEYKFNTAVSTDDIFLTVYTCGNNYDYADAQSRIYYFLKAVK